MNDRPDMTGYILAAQLPIGFPLLLGSTLRTMPRAELEQYREDLHQALVMHGGPSGHHRALDHVRLHIRRGGTEPHVQADEILDGLQPLLEVLSCPRLRNPHGLGYIIDCTRQYVRSISVELLHAKPFQTFTTVEIWQPLPARPLMPMSWAA